MPLEQRPNLTLKLIQGRKTRVLKANASVASDNECRRKAGHRRESLLKVFPVMTDKHRIVHLELFDELLHIRRRIIHGNAKDDETARLVRVVESDESRNLFLAGRAPRRPEVQQDDIAFECTQGNIFPIDVFDVKLRSATFPWTSQTSSAASDFGGRFAAIAKKSAVPIAITRLLVLMR